MFRHVDTPVRVVWETLSESGRALAIGCPTATLLVHKDRGFVSWNCLEIVCVCVCDLALLQVHEGTNLYAERTVFVTICRVCKSYEAW